MRFLKAAIMIGATLMAPAAASDELKEYGEYLAGECTTCHQLDGKDTGIPSIVGLDAESFVALLNSYKSGERENEAMKSVAQSLDDEQVKALAAYFSSLKPKK